jgi:cell division protein FtsI (penicillin-binding protein 3)
LLQGVVDGGTGSQAGIDGMAVAGKTGTAQKVDGKTGRYSARDRVSSFIGFVPTAAPRFVILVVIDSPQAATYGGLVAAPVFRRIAEYYIERLGLRIASAPAQGPEADPLGPQLASWTLATGEGGMPSFIGLSMREALVHAVRAGWEVRTFGSGFVVAQDPPAGVAAAEGTVLTLQFGLDAG